MHQWNHVILAIGVVDYFIKILEKSWFQRISFPLVSCKMTQYLMRSDSFLYVDVW